MAWELQKILLSRLDFWIESINILRSGTRREDLLVEKDELNRVHMLRKVLSEQEEVAATEFLISKLKNTKTNEEFFASMTKSKSK